MNPKKLLIIFIFIILVVLFFVFILINSSERINILFGKPTPIPTVAMEEKKTVENPTPASSRNIEILEPGEGDKVESGFVVSGNARVFENTLNIRLLDSEGEVLVETFATTNAPDVGEFGSFEKQIEFETESKTGTLEVYQVDQESEKEIDKVTIPLVFIPQ